MVLVATYRLGCHQTGRMAGLFTGTPNTLSQGDPHLQHHLCGNPCCKSTSSNPYYVDNLMVACLLEYQPAYQQIGVQFKKIRRTPATDLLIASSWAWSVLTNYNLGSPGLWVLLQIVLFCCCSTRAGSIEDPAIPYTSQEPSHHIQSLP